MNEVKMREFVEKELKKIVVKLFPFKNKSEVDFILETWTESFIEDCTNIAKSENVDLRILLYKSINKIKKNMTEVKNNKFVTYAFLTSAIVEIATKDLNKELDEEIEESYNLLISRVLNMSDSYNYSFSNGILGGTVVKMGGVMGIVSRVVNGGVVNVFNNYQLDRFKSDFYKIYKNLKEQHAKGIDVAVNLILGKYKENGITSSLNNVKFLTTKTIPTLSEKENKLQILEEK